MARRKTDSGPPPAQAPGGREPPVMEYRLRNLKCAIWANPQDGGIWYSVTFSRSYKDGEGNWKSASSFGGTDCLLVAELARLAFHWIAQQHQGGTNSPAPATGGNGLPD